MLVWGAVSKDWIVANAEAVPHRLANWGLFWACQTIRALPQRAVEMLV